MQTPPHEIDPSYPAWDKRPCVEYTCEAEAGPPWQIRVCRLSLEAVVALSSLAPYLAEGAPTGEPGGPMDVDGQLHVMEHLAMLYMIYGPRPQAIVELEGALRGAREKAMCEFFRQLTSVAKQTNATLQRSIELLQAERDRQERARRLDLRLPPCLS